MVKILTADNISAVCADLDNICEPARLIVNCTALYPLLRSMDEVEIDTCSIPANQLALIRVGDRLDIARVSISGDHMIAIDLANRIRCYKQFDTVSILGTVRQLTMK